MRGQGLRLSPGPALAHSPLGSAGQTRGVVSLAIFGASCITALKREREMEREGEIFEVGRVRSWEEPRLRNCLRTNFGESSEDCEERLSHATPKPFFDPFGLDWWLQVQSWNLLQTSPGEKPRVVVRPRQFASAGLLSNHRLLLANESPRELITSRISASWLRP